MTFEQSLRAAEGYAELGMEEDALAELNQLCEADQNRLEALRIRVGILLQCHAWKEALRLSLRLTQLFESDSYGFIHAAFCLHELGKTERAKQLLLEGPASLLEEAVYYYNLGCYDTVLGNLDQAKAYLRASFRLDKSLRELAKQDPDLEKIRDAL